MTLDKDGDVSSVKEIISKARSEVKEETRQELLADLRALAQKIDGANALEQTIAKWGRIRETLDTLRTKTNEDCALCPVYSPLLNSSLPRCDGCKGCPARVSTNLHVAIIHSGGETLCSLGMDIRTTIFSLYSCITFAIEELRKNADNTEQDEEEESNE